MQLGIIGAPGSGKTTIFLALSSGHQPAGTAAGRARPEVRTAVVDVPDPRLDALSALYRPHKTVHAKITFADVGGLTASGSSTERSTRSEGLPGPLVNLLAQMDGLLHVVRAFEDSNLPHPAGSVDPARDLAALQAELLLNDMVVAERRLERLAEERQRGGRDRATVEREQELFRRVSEHLSTEQPLRSLSLTTEEEKALTVFGLLTLKPVLVVLNLGEGQAPPELGAPSAGCSMLSLQGKLEMEIAQLPPEDALPFLEEYGLTEPGVKRVIRCAYDLLGVNTFFTVSEEEVHAWRLPRGGTALDAAGTVHSDLARGFIRAEVIAWDELIALGGLAQARAKGKLRIEGKTYPVAEGEVVYIRFNV